MGREVSCLFYGSFMNRDVLAKVGHQLVTWEVVAVPGFEIRIEPHANLVRSVNSVAFGLLTPLSHGTLDALYAEQSRGEVYLPEALVVLGADGTYRAALSYLVSEMKVGPATAEYVEMIALTAEENRFPAWYIQRIRSFAS